MIVSVYENIVNDLPVNCLIMTMSHMTSHHHENVLKRNRGLLPSHQEFYSAASVMKILPRPSTVHTR